MPEEEHNEMDEREAAPRPFWSGTITFGLVSIPVELFPGSRSSRVSLRMLSPEGVPLSRRYYSPETGKEVAAEDAVRGYEMEDGRYVVITDEELEQVAPEKSRDIDLRRFVPSESIAPLYFERSYFFAPGGDSTKAYRLLAKTMEQSGRAGIATFVMRGKEYLVAIFAQNGILTAETLRFQDEIRTPADVGLPEKLDPAKEIVRRYEKAIESAEASALDEAEMRNREAERIEALIEKKRRQNKVIEMPAPARREAESIDIMDVLRRSLERDGDGGGEPRRERREAPVSSVGRHRELEKLSKEELYQRAKKLDISGRSGMSKPQLVNAILGSERK